ncbi:CGNR zinc finger domain-containing protein [Streptosporangiaceae bacterium NEAU-GS5]|nr:CGNR zinc finger domain-containing protein [Streptosporangiaceae bacterium NEAU-GS5]
MWSVQLRPADRISPRLGGRLCLAVVNSVLWRRSAEPTDLVGDYTGLITYMEDIGGLAVGVAADLMVEADAHPDQAREEFGRVIALREDLYDVMSATAHGDCADLTLLNAVFSEGMANLTLNGGLVWAGLRVPAWETGASAVALLTGPDLAQLKQCPGEKCGWLFVDQTRNKSRTWCDSRMCGNRDRVRRHYQRSR